MQLEFVDRTWFQNYNLLKLTILRILRLRRLFHESIHITFLKNIKWYIIIYFNV